MTLSIVEHPFARKTILATRQRRVTELGPLRRSCAGNWFLKVSETLMYCSKKQYFCETFSSTQYDETTSRQGCFTSVAVMMRVMSPLLQIVMLVMQCSSIKTIQFLVRLVA